MDLVYTKGLCRFHDGRVRKGFTEEQLALPKGFKSIFKSGWVHKGYRQAPTTGITAKISVGSAIRG